MATYSAQTIAEVLLLDPRRVQQLSKEGIIPKVSKGQYDLVESVQGYIRYLRDQTKGRDPERVAEEKKIATENRRLKELARKELEGELVNAKDLEIELIKLFTNIKTRVRSIAPKTAQEITHLKLNSKTEREMIAAVQEVLKREHDEALQEMSEWKR